MTTIRNGRGIQAVQAFQDQFVVGQPIGGDEHDNRSYENPLLPQITLVTLAATADATLEVVAGQVWTITLTDPDSVPYVTIYTVTAGDEAFATGGATGAQVLEYMAAVLAGQLEANPALVNVVAATSSAAVITVTWLHPDQGSWTVAAVCAPAAVENVLVATPALDQAAGGTPIPMGRVVVMAPSQSLQGRASAVLPTDAVAVIAGITLRDLSQSRPFVTAADATDDYAPGEMMGVREENDVAVENVDPATAVVGSPVYTVIDTTGGQALGQLRASAAGVAQVVTATPTVANTTTYRLQVDLPAYDGLPSLTRTFEILSDGTATDAEIVAAFQLQMDADAAFTAQVVASGTTTLVLTGQVPGRPFTVLDVQEGAGDWASITTTTPAAAYTRFIPRWIWSRRTVSGQIGTVRTAR